jgi:PEP-CTERM motif
MKYLGLASVVVLTLSLGMFIPQAGAKNTNTPKEEAHALKLQKEEALALKKQEAHALKLQKEEALALKKQEAHALKHSGNYVGPNANSGNHVGANSTSSVPEPGTFLLVGLAFAGLVWWRARQARA